MAELLVLAIPQQLSFINKQLSIEMLRQLTRNEATSHLQGGLL